MLNSILVEAIVVKSMYLAVIIAKTITTTIIILTIFVFYEFCMIRLNIQSQTILKRRRS